MALLLYTHVPALWLVKNALGGDLHLEQLEKPISSFCILYHLLL